jgi:putative tricarboxylic transport membrane protein
VSKDRIVGASFLVLGIALVASSYALPPGLGRVPGPGFFPRVIGGVMLLLSASLLWQARRPAPAPSTGGADTRTVLFVVGLLFLYLLAWGTGPFAVRTAVFLLLLLRGLGQPWRAALTLSLSLTAVVILAFQLGLRVPLG